MNAKSASLRLAGLLLLSATFGCQATGGQKGATVTPVQQPPSATIAAVNETPAPESAAAPKEQRVVEQKAEIRPALTDMKDKTSYSVGLDLGRDLQAQELGLNIEPLLQGIRDSLLGREPLLSDAELEIVKQTFIKERLASRAKALGAEAEKNFREGEAFLQQNAKKEGVKTLRSGLQYKVLKSVAEGATPSINDNVKAHYIVKSLEGKELDSTYKMEGPAVFPVNGVVPAWTEALQLMKVGEKWEIYAPSYMAYGEKGVGNVVGPFQTLIVELELLGIH